MPDLPRMRWTRAPSAGCSPQGTGWLRYGVQPDHPGPGLIPGQCRMKAHDRDNLGVTRRVLPSRLWSGKTVDRHKADRAQVVRKTLLSAGMDDLDLDRMAATVTLLDGSPRFVWTDVRPDHDTYVKVILDSISERQRWRAQYEAGQDSGRRLSAPLWTVFRQLPSRHDRTCLTTARPHPMTRQTGPEGWRSGVSAANRAATPTGALDGQTAGPNLPDRGRPSTRTTNPAQPERTMIMSAVPVSLTPRWYTVAQVAQLLNYGESKVRMLIITGQLRSIKDGRSRRILPEWVEAYVQDRAKATEDIW